MTEHPSRERQYCIMEYKKQNIILNTKRFQIKFDELIKENILTEQVRLLLYNEKDG